MRYSTSYADPGLKLDAGTPLLLLLQIFIFL
jgi:hypothetical protein